MAASQSLYPSNPSFPERPTTRNTLDELTHARQENTTLPGSGSYSAELIVDLNIVLWWVIPPLFLLCGTFGNVMTVVVMRGMRVSPSTACLSLYFTALAVSDQCQLVPKVIYYWVHFNFRWPPSLFRFNVLCLLPKCMWNVTEFTSAWLLVAMTYQRVTSVVTPHRVGLLCTVRRGKMIVALLVLVSCALHFHFLVTWGYYPEYGECFYGEGYTHLAGYFEWQDLWCQAALPFLFLVVGNAVLIGHVMKSLRTSHSMGVSRDQQATSKRKDKVHSMSVTLITTSTAYLLCTFPPSIFDVYLKSTYVTIFDDQYYGAAIKSLARTFGIFGWLTAASSNFYLYLLSGHKFRGEAKRYLCCRSDAP